MEGRGRRALTIIEAARKIGCGRSKAYELIRQGRLRALKLDHNTIVLEEDAEAFLATLPAVEPRKAA